jgi:hypothetical protein
MGRAGVLAGVVMLLAGSGAFAQEAEEGLRPGLPDSETIENTAILTTQTPVPTDEPTRRVRRSVPQDRLGIGSATLRLFSSIEIGGVVSSNADRARGGVKADAGLRVAPSLRLQSNWARHEWTADANGGLDYFIDSDQITTSTVDLRSRFRLDIRRTTTAVFDGAVALSESSGDRKKLDTEYSGGAALTHDFGGLDAQVRVGVLRLNSGVDAALDYTEPSVALRGELATDTGLNPFITVTYAPRLFDRNGSRRNSHGGSVAAGVVFDRAPFVSGSLAATYQVRDFDDGTIGAFGVAGSMTWTPTDFTVITATSGVDINENGAASASRNWTAALGFSHSLSDDFSVFADASLDIEDGAGPADVTLTSDVGVRWQANPYLAWSLAYGTEFFVGGGAGDDYDDHRVTASVILRR